MAASLSFSIGKGEAVTLSGIHEVSSTDTTPVDITGWTIKLTVKASYESTTVIFSKTGTVISGPAGTYSFAFTHADTNIKAGQYTCDIWRTDSGGERLMGIGTLTVVADVLYGD